MDRNGDSGRLPVGRLGGLCIAVAANVAASMFDVPDLRRVAPGTDYEFDNDPGTFTVLDDRGYFVGPPQPDDLWQRLFEAAERQGLDSARLHIRTTGLWGEDPIAFDVVAREHGIREASLVDAGEPEDLIVNTWFEGSAFPGQDRLRPVCGQIDEGVGFDGEPLVINVSVKRLQPEGGYRSWCDF